VINGCLDISSCEEGDRRFKLVGGHQKLKNCFFYFEPTIITFLNQSSTITSREMATQINCIACHLSMQVNAAENASVCIRQRRASIDWFGYQIVQCRKPSEPFSVVF
jgi:hypothetical protein